MPAMVRDYRGYRIAIYSQSSHFAVITAPGSNRVLALGDREPRSTIVEGPLVCFDRAKVLVESFLDDDARPPS
jgi:hypothetical protein